MCATDADRYQSDSKETAILRDDRVVDAQSHGEPGTVARYPERVLLHLTRGVERHVEAVTVELDSYIATGFGASEPAERHVKRLVRGHGQCECGLAITRPGSPGLSVHQPRY